MSRHILQRLRQSKMLAGGSFGARNNGMRGRVSGPRFLWTLPNSRISIMGGERAGGALVTVCRDTTEAVVNRLSAMDFDTGIGTEKLAEAATLANSPSKAA